MVAIDVNSLTKDYGNVRAIESLSFAVEDGEVFGFLGPNGAGKSTTIRTLMGFQSPTDGNATVLGHDITDRSAMIEAKRSIGYIPAEMGFDEGVTGERFLRYQASLKGDMRSEELLELFDPPMNRNIGEYSTGNKRKLAVVLAFMHDPDLVIMDEPTSGLDPLMQERFYEFIRDEQDEGVTFFFSSHVLSEVQKIADRVGVIRNGHLVELEDVETLLDRGGKRVSVHVAEPVEADAFAIEGAHDVSVTGDEGSTRPTAADGSGTTASASGREGASVSFTYTGDYNELLEHLVAYDVLDLDIADAPLEDVFMRFYGDIDPEAGAETAGSETDV
jgi:ABC-2 type transport system ATP-binding protein